MDRFFVAYDKTCKEKDFSVKWFFSGGKQFDFYNEMDIEICEKISAEDCLFKFSKGKGF